MNTDPGFALQAAIYSTLAAALSCGVYDRVPEGAAFPYATIGDDHLLTEYYGLESFSEANSKIHIWSRATSRGEGKKLSGQVKTALDASLPLDGFRMTTWAHSDTLSMLDPDGLTTHVIVTFDYTIQPYVAPSPPPPGSGDLKMNLRSPGSPAIILI